MKQPRELTPSELDQLLAEPSDRLIVLYLWGPDCPNCEIFKRSLPALTPKLAGLDVDFVSLDAYLYPEIARRYAVYGIPHFLLFKRGKKLGKMSEFRGEAFWLGVVREHAG
jgi:thioredoxin 1